MQASFVQSSVHLSEKCLLSTYTFKKNCTKAENLSRAIPFNQFVTLSPMQIPKILVPVILEGGFKANNMNPIIYSV